MTDKPMDVERTLRELETKWRKPWQGNIRSVNAAVTPLADPNHIRGLCADELKAVREALREPVGGTLGLDSGDGATERDWATDGPAWEKRAMEAEAKLALREPGALNLRHLAEAIHVEGQDRCAICFWPLAENAEKGCVRGNCSMRGEAGEYERNSHRAKVDVIFKVLNAAFSSKQEPSAPATEGLNDKQRHALSGFFEHGVSTREAIDRAIAAAPPVEGKQGAEAAPPTERKEIDLMRTTDGLIWAEEFMRIFSGKLEKIDRELMHSWFASAIMVGYDKGRNVGAAAGESAELRVALLKYGKHLLDCRKREWECGQPECGETHRTACSCGLDAAIRAASQERSATEEK